jgi:acetyltransferase-like isoleucine patch superfamily enzyme
MQGIHQAMKKTTRKPAVPNTDRIMIHPTAEVQTERIGAGTSVWQHCVILSGAVIGRNCNINCNVFIENKVVVGDRVTVKVGVQLWDGMTIEDDVFIGPNATFTNDLTPRSKHYPASPAETVIGKGASIGANSTLKGGIRIGRYAMIGAGSVVTCDVPPFTLWYGNPAKNQGFVTRDGTIVSPGLTDKTGRKYRLVKGEPKMQP